MATGIETLIADARAALDLLEAIEWAGDPVHFICPVCHVSRNRGHEAWCQLAAILERKKRINGTRIEFVVTCPVCRHEEVPVVAEDLVRDQRDGSGESRR